MINLGRLAVLVIFAGFPLSCGDDSSSTSSTPTATPIAWSTVAPLIASNCSGTTCHSGTGSQLEYVGNQSLVDERKANIKTTIEAGTMPFGQAWDSATSKSQVLQYVSQ